jgi:hypothetical protein
MSVVRDVIDTYSQAGDTVIAHDEVTAQAYRNAAAVARQRQESGLPPEGSPVRVTTEGPSEAPLPYLHVAEQVRGAKLRELETAKHRLEQDLSRSAFGASGFPVTDPGRIQMRQDQERGIELLSDQIDQLRGLEGDALRKWASDQGYQ